MNSKLPASRFATVELSIAGVPIDIREHLVEFEFNENSVASSDGRVLLFDSEWDRLEQFFARAGMWCPVDFKFGFLGDMSPTIPFVLGTYTPSFKESGVELDISIVDRGYRKGLEKKAKNWAFFTEEAWPGSGDIVLTHSYIRSSDIVLQICRENGWDPVVEETSISDLGFNLAQDNMSDPEYISYLAKYAASESQRTPEGCGEGGFTAYLYRGKELHFHRQKFVANSEPDGKPIYKRYVFARDVDGDVISFSPTNNSMAASYLGGEKTRFEFYDPRDKTTLEYNKNNADPGHVIAVPGRVTPLISEDAISKVINKPFSSRDEFNSYFTWRWEMASNKVLLATLEIVGDPFIKPLDLIHVDVIKRDGRPHDMWSGRFLVLGVHHAISAGEFTTELDLSRDTSAEGSVIVRGQELRCSNTASSTFVDRYADANVVQAPIAVVDPGTLPPLRQIDYTKKGG